MPPSRPRRRALMVLGGLLASVAVATVGGGPAPSVAEQRTEERIEHVRQRAPDDAVASAARHLGVVPADARERLETQQPVVELDARLRDRHPGYAGVWVDHDDGGAIKVRFTKDHAASLESARAQYPYPEKLVSVPARVPLRTLESANRVATGMLGDRLADGAEVLATMVDVPTNSVVVRLRGSTARSLALLRAELGPAPVRVTEVGGVPIPSRCTSRLRCDVSPLRGGIQESGNGCTLGFPATDIHFGWDAVTTAAHCASAGSTARHAGTIIGLYERSDGPGTTHPLVDAAMIRVTGPWPAGNFLYHSDADVQWSIGSRYLGNNVPTGFLLCNTGVASGGPECRNTSNGNWAGAVQNPDGVVYTMFNQIELVGCGVAGDSGGPIYDASPRRAYAVEHHAFPGTSCTAPPLFVYGSYVVHVQNHLGITVVG